MLLLANIKGITLQFYEMLKYYVFEKFKNKTRILPQKIRRNSEAMYIKNGKNQFPYESKKRSTIAKLNKYTSKVLNYFIVKDKHLIRKKSSKIDNTTNPRYLKLKVNNKKEYESISKEDVLEVTTMLMIEREKAQLALLKKKQKILLCLKKNKNYFIDFLRELNKNDQNSIKAIGKDSSLPDFMNPVYNKKLSRKGTSRMRNSRNGESIKPKEVINDQVSEQKEKEKSHLALIPSARMRSSALRKIKMSTQIDDNEAYVLTFKSSPSESRSLSKFGSRTYSALGQSHSHSHSPSRMNDGNMTRSSLGLIVSKMKSKNYKITDPEYIFIKAMMNAPIDLEDIGEKEKYVEENMNYEQKYYKILVIYINM